VSKNSPTNCACAWSAATVVKIATELEAAITALKEQDRAADKNRPPG
jgi:hypothetical protein